MKNQFSNIIEEFNWRGTLKDWTTSADSILIKEKITCYNGFDPTAKSLHIGNLIPILGLQRLQKYGHTPIVIVGGGTGMIGDPSGRTDERKLMSEALIEENLFGIKTQLEKSPEELSYLSYKSIVSNEFCSLDGGSKCYERKIGQNLESGYCSKIKESDIN